MLNLCGMGKDRFVAVVLILVLVSSTCNASLVFHLRKLIASEPTNAPTTSQASVSPTVSPVNEINTTPENAEKPPEETQKESQMSNPSNNETLSADPKDTKKNENGAPALPANENNGSEIDRGNDKDAATTTVPELGKDSSCKLALTSCRDKEMLACVEASKDEGSKEVFLVVQNEGESTLEVNVNIPNSLENVLPAFDVLKHGTKKIDISSIVGKSNELVVNSGNAKCELSLARPVSVDNLIRQLTFYSKQVTPIYAVYATFLLALLFGGTLACCKLRKRNTRQDGIPYQELEMGLPESASAVNVDVAEGWDNDWDDDDWDEDNAVKSPSANGVRNISATGLTIRSSKKDGWENDWED